jgi:serine/threonine protein kinase
MLQLQRTVGRYEIHQEIGRGGMAVVYLARQTDLDREVALKELGSFHAAEQAFAERFVRESRVVGSLNHPNVVTVYEYFEHDGTPFIAMEYVDRGSLRPWIGRMSLAQVAGVFEGVLAGLAHAAKHRVIHRDLKPENLMVTGEGAIKIADFGIAKALNQATVGRLLTATGTTVGTPTYMSPEQAMGRDLGPWTDLYSVGVMAYEMLVGRVPFHDAETPMAILMRHVNEPIPAPRSVRPELDPGLAAWIERLLAKAPTERTQGAHQAWDELEDIVLDILGPRWRRDARLLELELPSITEEQPLTPAPFDPESEDGFETFRQPVPRPEAATARELPPQEPDPHLDRFPTPDVVPAPPAGDSQPPVGPTSGTAETLPPQTHPPGGATSFQWPTTGRRPSRGLLWIGLAAAIAVATMLLGVLVTMSLGGPGDADAGGKPPVTTVSKTNREPKQKPRARLKPRGPIARHTALTETDTAVVATIRFTRARLERKTLATRDGDLTDGAATVLIAQRGLKSVIGVNKLGGLSFKPTDTANRLTIALSAAPGAFTAVHARPDRTGSRVVIIATKKPRVTPSDDGSSDGGASDGTTDKTRNGGTKKNGTTKERKFLDGKDGSGNGCSSFEHQVGNC